MADVFEIQPLEHAPYSASATVFPEASIGFSGTYTAEGSTVAAQANAAFAKLGEDLEAVGLGPEDVVNVRGYLKSIKGESMDEAMKQWSGAFSRFFESNEDAPTRTTVGVSELRETEALLALDCVIAADSSMLKSVDLGYANDRIRATEFKGGSTLRFAKPFSSMFFSSGTLADALVAGGTDYGSVEQQTLSAFAKLKESLRAWGLVSEDIVFVRALLSPDSEVEGSSVDFEGFDVAWNSIWKGNVDTAPALSVSAAPGFNVSGRLVEIEVYAVFPEAAGPFVGGDLETYPIMRKGLEASFLSASAAIARDSNLVWFSGAIDRSRDHIGGQGVESLLTLQERMGVVGIDFDSVFQLRAYLNVQESFPKEFGAWNEAYRRFFDHSKLNATKPVRTAFPIENLPGGVLIEIELIGAYID